MRDGKTVVIMYGTYDLSTATWPFWSAPVRWATTVFVGATSECLRPRRGKLNVHQSLSDRLQAVVATGLMKSWLRNIRVKRFPTSKTVLDSALRIGSDWQVRLPEQLLQGGGPAAHPGRFRAPGRAPERMKPVMWAASARGYLTDRFIVDECTHVAGIDVTNMAEARVTGIPVAESLDATACTPWMRLHFPLRLESTASTSRAALRATSPTCRGQSPAVPQPEGHGRVVRAGR